MRTELKYIVSPMQAEILSQRIRLIGRPDAHGTSGTYPVVSVYYDSADGEFLGQKENGEFIHVKVRLRHYGAGSPAFLETKVKIGSRQLKFRQETDSTGATLSSYPGDPETLRYLWVLARLGPEVGLQPRCEVSFRRQAFEIEEHRMRITFDSSISVRAWGDDERIPVLPGQIIVEMKCVEGESPSWLGKELAALGGAVTVSKYVESIECLRSRRMESW